MADLYEPGTLVAGEAFQTTFRFFVGLRRVVVTMQFEAGDDVVAAAEECFDAEDIPEYVAESILEALAHIVVAHRPSGRGDFSPSLLKRHGQAWEVAMAKAPAFAPPAPGLPQREADLRWLASRRPHDLDALVALAAHQAQEVQELTHARDTALQHLQRRQADEMEELEGLGKGGSALLHTVEQHVSELRHAERAWSRVAALRGEELCQRWWARTADAVTEACKQRGQSEQHDVASALAAGQEQARREVDSAAPFRLSLRLLPPDAPAVPREHALRSGPGMRGEERLLLKEDSQNFLQGGGLPALAAHSAAPAPSVASAADPAPPLAARGARLAGLVASTLISDSVFVVRVGRTYIIRLVVLPAASALSYADLEYRRCSDRLVLSPADNDADDGPDTPMPGDENEDGTSDGTPRLGASDSRPKAAQRSLWSESGTVVSGTRSGGPGTGPPSRQGADTAEGARSAPTPSAGMTSAGAPAGLPPLAPLAARCRTAPLRFGVSRVVARACLGGGGPGDGDHAADAMSDEARDHALHAANLAVGTGAPPVVLLLPVGLRDTGLLTPAFERVTSLAPDYYAMDPASQLAEAPVLRAEEGGEESNGCDGAKSVPAGDEEEDEEEEDEEEGADIGAEEEGVAVSEAPSLTEEGRSRQQRRREELVEARSMARRAARKRSAVEAKARSLRSGDTVWTAHGNLAAVHAIAHIGVGAADARALAGGPTPRGAPQPGDGSGADDEPQARGLLGMRRALLRADASGACVAAVPVSLYDCGAEGQAARLPLVARARNVIRAVREALETCAEQGEGPGLREVHLLATWPREAVDWVAVGALRQEIAAAFSVTPLDAAGGDA